MYIRLLSLEKDQSILLPGPRGLREYFWGTRFDQILDVRIVG